MIRVPDNVTCREIGIIVRSIMAQTRLEEAIALLIDWVMAFSEPSNNWLFGLVV